MKPGGRQVSAKRRIHVLSVVVGSALALLVPAIASASANAGPGVAALAPDTEDPAVQAMAAESYVRHFGVPLPVAYQRLQLQDAAIGVLTKVQGTIGPEFGGAWFDNNDGGRLKIGVARSPGAIDGAAVQQAKRALASEGVGSVTDFVPVAASAGDLNALHDQTDRRLAKLLDEQKVETYIDYARNAVIVKTATDLTVADNVEVNGAVGAAGSLMRQDSNEPDLSLQRTSCAFKNHTLSSELFCDPPLRGGDTIVNTAGVCTGGFIVWNTQRTTPYLLTAGHCASSAVGSTWQSRFSDDSIHNIGTAHSYNFSSSGDYGLINISNPSGWGISGYPTSYVWVGPSAGGSTQQDSFYTISGGQDAVQGETVCLTGAIPLPPVGDHTDCGPVQGGLHTRGGVSGLFEGFYCSADGSSGGPIFKVNKAHGTEVGSDSACDSYFMPESTESHDASHPFVF